MRGTLIAAALLLASVAFGQKDKGTRLENIYMFGVSQELTDSVVYISAVCEVENLGLEKKTKFLPFRSTFSRQMEEYLEGGHPSRQQTVAVFFATSRKAISRKYYKVKKRYLDNPYTKIHILDESQFKFANPWADGDE